MKTELIELSPTRREIRIEIDQPAVAKVYDAVSRRYAKNANIPGFRKGSAPLDVIRLRFKEEINNDVLRQLLPGCVSDAIKEHKIEPLGEPNLHLEDAENIKLDGSMQVSVHVHLDVMPEVPLPEYKGLEGVRRVRKVGEDEIEHIIEDRRKASAIFVPVEDRKSQIGDTVVVDLEGKFDSRPNEEPIKAEDLQVTLGDDKIEKSFSDNLVGLEQDDEKSFTVEYPADFSSPGLAGQKVSYNAKVKSVGKIEIPAADDEWAKSLDEDFESMKDLRAKLRDDLDMVAKQNADAKLRDDLVTQLIKRHNFEVPNALIDSQSRNLLNNFLQDLRARGANVKTLKDEVLKSIYDQMRVQAESDVRGALLLEEIAQIEKVEVNGDEIASEIEKIAQYYHSTTEEIRTSLTKHGGENSIADRIRSRKAVEKIIDNAKISEGEWIEETEANMKIPAAEPIPTDKSEGDAEPTEST